MTLIASFPSDRMMQLKFSQSQLRIVFFLLTTVTPTVRWAKRYRSSNCSPLPELRCRYV